MTSKKIIFGFISKNEEPQDEKISIDVFYQEKYKEMRRHRDYQLTTANWCTVILLAIIAGFVSLNKDNLETITQFGSCGELIFKIIVVLFVCAIVVLGSKIVDHSAKRYSHLREWVSENMEPTINGKKYKPARTDIPIQTVIIAILVFLGLLTIGIVIIF
jgi:hypothetical protein